MLLLYSFQVFDVALIEVLYLVIWLTKLGFLVIAAFTGFLPVVLCYVLLVYRMNIVKVVGTCVFNWAR